MRLKFTYQRPRGTATDLVAELDASATVGQLATYLADADPQGDSAAPTAYTLARQSGGILDPTQTVAGSGLGSGVTVTITPAPTTMSAAVSAVDAAAKAVVVSGPDVGREFLLHFGSAVAGREKGCEIQLTDPKVSRRHARFNVGETVEVVDLGSANGIEVGTAPVERAALNSADIVTLGDTELTVTRLRETRRGEGTIEFIRPAQVIRTYEGKEFTPPEPPERKESPRFPTVALLMPLFMGGVLYLVTKRWESVIFVALSPLMLLGNAMEGRLFAKRSFKRAAAGFRDDLATFVGDVRAEHGDEVAGRLYEHPSAAECATAAASRDPLVWCRRPDLPRYAEVRLGLGTRPSRSEVEVSRTGRAPYELVRELDQALAPLGTVAGVPVTANLADGAVGIAGPRVALLGSARSVLTQLVVLHSPAELVIAAILDSDSVPDWDWLKWIPHTSSPHSPLTGRHLVSGPADVGQLVVALEGLIAERRAAEADSTPLPTVATLVESSTSADHARLVALAEEGPTVGVHVIWLAPSRALLPASCKTFLEAVPEALGGTAGYVVEGEEVSPILLDTADHSTALSVAQALAPMADAGAPAEDDSDLPRAISQLATMEDTSLATRAESVIERWTASNSILTGPYAPPEPVKKAGTLRAVIGKSTTGLHTLDLRTDGPHALVGGTTNSGKSELLQSWILAMAASHSPERVTFLLVDYKGGSAFGDCNELPHTIGLVTDLGPHMVRRAMTSLSAELKYREEILHRHDAKDLIELERHGVAGVPPSLVIVVDEFAALVNEVPEFIEGVVNVAQRGRSLGLHLILATQQPSGVIKGSLRANTNLRIALRVADVDDSVDVVGEPDAAGFDPGIPGRAISRSGPKRLTLFQTAYAGGWTDENPKPPQPTVESLDIAAPAEWRPPEDEVQVRDRDQTDIKRLVSTIQDANQLAALPVPRKAWLPVLPPVVDLSLLPTIRRDYELVFALGDDPEEQSQPVVSFYPDREGNLAVYGTGGSGKSGVLRALAIAAGFAQRGGPCHVYGLDFGSRALQMLEPLPHVGSIIPGSDSERVMRLITWLRETIDERRVRYAGASASTITAYRARAERPAEPRILLLVDNVGAFRQAYETSDRQRYLDMFGAIASEGRPVGVHVVLSAGERTAIHTGLSSAIQRRIVLRMATAEDYAMLGVPMDVLNEHTPPGRGIDGDREIQAGTLGSDAEDAAQAAQIRALATALDAAQVSRAPEIASLASEVALHEVPPAPQDVTIGIDAASLTSIGVDARGGFLVTGPPGSGRSTALATIVASAHHYLPGVQLHYFGDRRSRLSAWEGWASVSVTPEEIAERAQRLADEVVAPLGTSRRHIIIAESAGDLVMSPAENALQALVKACNVADQWFVAEGEVSTLRSSTGFLGLLKASRRGLALQPDQETGITLFNTPFPRVNRADFPEGRGFLVGAGRASLIQTVTPPEHG